MARSSDLFFQQYNVFGKAWMQGQLAAPLRESRRAFLAQIPRSLKGKTLLDAGCGYGHDLREFLRRGARVHGIDASKTMIALARQYNPDLTTLSVQRVQNTTFAPRFFDLVVSQYAIHNALDLDHVFAEMHRILKPGGLMIYLVQHPLFVFLVKRRKDYHRRETVEFKIQDLKGRCAIRQPSHTFGEYFSGFVLEHFHVRAFQESPLPVPFWFVVILQKRRRTYLPASVRSMVRGTGARRSLA